MTAHTEQVLNLIYYGECVRRCVCQTKSGREREREMEKGQEMAYVDF